MPAVTLRVQSRDRSLGARTAPESVWRGGHYLRIDARVLPIPKCDSDA